MSARLRPARTLDASRCGDILWGYADVPWEEDLFSSAEAIACCDRMIAAGSVTVAELDGVIEAFLVRDGDLIDALYVSPRAGRKRLGRALIEAAKEASAQLRLFVHADNQGARQFYHRMGFKRAHEGETPDQRIEMVWTAPPPAPPPEARTDAQIDVRAEPQPNPAASAPAPASAASTSGEDPS